MNENEIVREFLVESAENLDQLDQAFVQLEKDPHDRTNLAGIFRTIHTIKGTSGFLGFGTLERVAHAGENLLSLLREGTLALDAPMTSALLRVVDATRRMLTHVEATGSDGGEDYSSLIAELERLATRTPDTSAVVAEAAPDAPVPLPALEPANPPIAVLQTAADVDAPAPQGAASLQVTQADEAGTTVPNRRSGQDRRSGDDRRAQDEKAPAAADSSLRIDVGLLDRLMNLVGELVLARNQILQYTATQTDSAFVSATQRLNLVTSELQEGVMKTRMQPIGNIWTKFPRIVRDLAVQCGREVRIEMEGRDTELDKTIIEAIKDPLTHIVRNSVDHGIEPPDERAAKGKPREGVLSLRAFHEGGQINIEIADDGAGIDPEKVKRKAVSRGIIASEQAARLGDHEATRLVFLPGFSTAEKISNISGRGVGMDVVKTNIEKIGGQVDIHSVVGSGTTLKIKIPLTLAIIPALIVAGADGERYAIPQVSLLELVRLEGTQARTGIESIQGTPFYRLRGNLLPLVYLDEAFERGTAQRDPEVVNIVVLKADDRQFGLIVDAIHDTEEIVVKPLGKQLKGIATFAGATIMGDGRVALILDVMGIAQRAHVISEARDRRISEGDAGDHAGDPQHDLQALLVCRVGDADRMAIPLNRVARLEEFPTTSIERSGSQDVVQYRGVIMPLIDLSTVFTGRPTQGGDLRQVVVHGEGDRSVGLVVGQILDIVNERIDIQRRSTRHGVLGSVVIQQRVTDLIDVAAVVGTSSASDTWAAA
ncbi:MAG: chemotaxis protein CheW [Acidobacteria bacterium]|nr:chemotaxis protein CheW [Acidobacteriota bacterium]